MGETENAVLPPGWAWATLGDLGRWTGGGTPSKAQASFWTGGSIPWVSPKDMKTDHVGKAADRITKAAVRASATKVVPRRSILCVIRSGILQHTFPVALAECRVTLNQDMRALTTFHGIDPRYIHLFLKLQNDRVLQDCSKDGTTVASINVDQLRQFAVPVAPHAEQLRIVEEAEALLWDVDDAEAALKRARERMADYRISLLHAACTGALTAGWRDANPEPEEDGPALLRRILAERRAAWECDELARLTKGGKQPSGDAWKRRYPEPQALPDYDRPTLPATWAWASLDQLMGRITSGSRAWSPYYGRGDGTFIMAQNVRPRRFKPLPRQLVDPPTNDPERERTRVIRDDLLVTIVGANTGDTCRIDVDVTNSYVCQSVGLLRPVITELAAFLETYLTSAAGGQAAFAQMMYGAGRPHLSFDQLRSVPIPVPPLQEQSQIAFEIANHAVDDRQDDDDSGRTGSENLITDLRQSILHAAFAGRLVPQDPADEPASTLLARLRADAAQSTPRRRNTRAGARP